MSGTDISLNIAGSRKKIPEDERNRRASDGVNIVLRSGHHRKKIDKVAGNIDKDVREHVEKVIKSASYDALNQSFNSLFSGDNAIEAAQKSNAEKLFTAIKKEANIVASSFGGMLQVGKQTSKISGIISKIPLGIGVGIVSAVNNAMRAVFGKIMGDKDIKHSKVEGAVFDIKETLPAQTGGAPDSQTGGKAGSTNGAADGGNVGGGAGHSESSTVTPSKKPAPKQTVTSVISQPVLQAQLSKDVMKDKNAFIKHIDNMLDRPATSKTKEAIGGAWEKGDLSTEEKRKDFLQAVQYIVDKNDASANYLHQFFAFSDPNPIQSVIDFPSQEIKIDKEKEQAKAKIDGLEQDYISVIERYSGVTSQSDKEKLDGEHRACTQAYRDNAAVAGYSPKEIGEMLGVLHKKAVEQFEAKRKAAYGTVQNVSTTSSDHAVNAHTSQPQPTTKRPAAPPPPPDDMNDGLEELLAAQNHGQTTIEQRIPRPKDVRMQGSYDNALARYNEARAEFQKEKADFKRETGRRKDLAKEKASRAFYKMKRAERSMAAAAGTDKLVQGAQQAYQRK